MVYYIISTLPPPLAPPISSLSLKFMIFSSLIIVEDALAGLSMANMALAGLVLSLFPFPC